jgi:hypothetical protein
MILISFIAYLHALGLICIKPTDGRVTDIGHLFLLLFPSNDPFRFGCDLMTNTFGRYLSALKTSADAVEAQLTTADLALQRCRNAIEWQFAVSEQAHLLAETIQRAMEGLANQPAAPSPAGLTLGSLDAKSTLLGMQHTSQRLGQELVALLAVVSKVEHLTADLAQHNDAATAAHHQILKSQAQSA